MTKEEIIIELKREIDQYGELREAIGFMKDRSDDSDDTDETYEAIIKCYASIMVLISKLGAYKDE